MRRIVLFLLTLFVLTACERGLPTAAEISDDALTAAVVLPGLDEPVNVNLATATTLQLVVPDLPYVPTVARATNYTYSDFTDLEEHAIKIDCPTHFGDYDADGAADDLLLHFDVASLFPSSVYTSATVPIDVYVTLHVEFEEAEVDDFNDDYLVKLVWNAPRGFQGGR